MERRFSRVRESEVLHKPRRHGRRFALKGTRWLRKAPGREGSLGLGSFVSYTCARRVYTQLDRPTRGSSKTCLAESWRQWHVTGMYHRGRRTDGERDKIVTGVVAIRGVVFQTFQTFQTDIPCSTRLHTDFPIILLALCYPIYVFHFDGPVGPRTRHACRTIALAPATLGPSPFASIVPPKRNCHSPVSRLLSPPPLSPRRLLSVSLRAARAPSCTSVPCKYVAARPNKPDGRAAHPRFSKGIFSKWKGQPQFKVRRGGLSLRARVLSLDLGFGLLIYVAPSRSLVSCMRGSGSAALRASWWSPAAEDILVPILSRSVLRSPRLLVRGVPTRGRRRRPLPWSATIPENPALNAPLPRFDFEAASLFFGLLCSRSGLSPASWKSTFVFPLFAGHLCELFLRA